jgi:hypothetical protein
MSASILTGNAIARARPPATGQRRRRTRWLFCLACLWLANYYFARDSSGFSVLLRFYDAQAGRSFNTPHATLARLLGPSGVRSIVAESLLLKHQLLIVNRSRQRSPNLSAWDRILAGWMALLVRPTRLLRSAIVLKPSTLLSQRGVPADEVSSSASPSNIDEEFGDAQEYQDHQNSDHHVRQHCQAPSISIPF